MREQDCPVISLENALCFIRRCMPHLGRPKLQAESACICSLVGLLSVHGVDQVSGERTTPSPPPPGVAALLQGVQLGYSLASASCRASARSAQRASSTPTPEHFKPHEHRYTAMGPKNQAGSAGFHDALLSSPVAPKNSKRWASAKDVAPPTPLPASGSSPKPLSLLGGLKAAVKKKKK